MTDTTGPSDFARGWQHAIDWLRQRADCHAGRWMMMDAIEALKATVAEMETLHVE